MLLEVIMTLVNIANLFIFQHAEVVLWYYGCCTQRIYAVNMLGTSREWNTPSHVLHCVIIRTRRKVDYIECQGLFFVCMYLTVCADVCQEFCLLLTAHLSHMEVCNLNIEGKVWPAIVCHVLWQQLTWQVMESLYRR